MKNTFIQISTFHGHIPVLLDDPLLALELLEVVTELDELPELEDAPTLELPDADDDPEEPLDDEVPSALPEGSEDSSGTEGPLLWLAPDEEPTDENPPLLEGDPELEPLIDGRPLPLPTPDDGDPSLDEPSTDEVEDEEVPLGEEPTLGAVDDGEGTFDEPVPEDSTTLEEADDPVDSLDAVGKLEKSVPIADELDASEPLEDPLTQPQHAQQPAWWLKVQGPTVLLNSPLAKPTVMVRRYKLSLSDSQRMSVSLKLIDDVGPPPSPDEPPSPEEPPPPDDVPGSDDPVPVPSPDDAGGAELSGGPLDAGGDEVAPEASDEAEAPDEAIDGDELFSTDVLPELATEDWPLKNSEEPDELRPELEPLELELPADDE